MIRSYKVFETFVPKQIDARETTRKQRTYETVAKLFTEEKCPANYANLINDYLIDQFKEKYKVDVKVYDNNYMVFFILSEEEPHQFKLETEPFLRFYDEHEMEIDFQIETVSYDDNVNYTISGAIKSPEDIWNIFDKKVLQIYLIPRIDKKILESVEIVDKFDPYEELRKYWKKMKYGLRNLDSHVIYRSERGRSQINNNALKSMFVAACAEDVSIIKDNNWEYVFDNISRHNTHGESGLKLVKHIVETYKPSLEKIQKVFTSLTEGITVPAADYLLPMIPDKDLKDLASSIMPHGISKTQNDLWRCNWFVNKGIITCDPNGGPRTYLANAQDAVNMVQFSITTDAGWKLLKDPNCVYTRYFFENLEKHPNNGGLNSSEQEFRKILFKLFHIPQFRQYVLEHPEECIQLEAKYNEFFHVNEKD